MAISLSRNRVTNQARKIGKGNEVFQVTVAMIHVALRLQKMIPEDMISIGSLLKNTLVDTDATEVEVVPMTVTRAASAQDTTKTATTKVDAECKFD